MMTSNQLLVFWFPLWECFRGHDPYELIDTWHGLRIQGDMTRE